jgi:NADH:ubiquinone oxidoreductase subunit F (NADH-binding)/NADH:ubiquinone oxidoreductase subunit E
MISPSRDYGFYEPVILPRLQRIQRAFGYLKREELERFAKEEGIPLYRLQAVASFFPHFRLSAPTKVTVCVCRDMACRMKGSGDLLRDLRDTKDVTVRAVSCLGRCDRAPAAYIVGSGLKHAQYFLGRSGEELKTNVDTALRGASPVGDTDAGNFDATPSWLIDPYGKGKRDYEAARKVIAARDASLDAAVAILKSQKQWDVRMAGQFRLAAIQRGRTGFALEPEVSEAVREWQTGSAWAKGPTLGGWTDEFLEGLKEANLRGMGGAGIAAIQKWSDVRDAVREARRRRTDDRAYIVVNGDESEPGTFKDRELLLRKAHLVVESVILAGLITDATQGFIYIRHEYEEQIEACRAEIEWAEQQGFCGTELASALGRPFPISIFPSPGGYICGEQSALVEAMSDRRGEPRNMPPKLETNGLQDQPTLVSNVETFAWVPLIIRQGGNAYAREGAAPWKGRRLFSVSGDVKRPGVYEVPMGLPFRDLVYGEEYCQGIVGDRSLKAIAPSGPSGGFLPATLKQPAGLYEDGERSRKRTESWEAFAARRGFDPRVAEWETVELELELELFREFSPTQALGAGIVVYAEGRDMVEEALNATEFFRDESCGKCVPCRLGSQKLASLGRKLMEGQITAGQWKQNLKPLLEDMGRVLNLTSICGLGRSVPNPLLAVAEYFPEDLQQHLTGVENSEAAS